MLITTPNSTPIYTHLHPLSKAMCTRLHPLKYLSGADTLCPPPLILSCSREAAQE
jgi:hypothetical protein